jgi:hypothetical protein
MNGGLRVSSPNADVGNSADGSSFGHSQDKVTSPFAPAHLYAAAAGGEPPVATVGKALMTPFAESMTVYGQDELDTEAADALLAELADEEFEEALNALTDEAACRHLRSTGTWSPSSGAPVLVTTEAEQWIESVAAEADRVLGNLEAYFADRPADSLRDGEIEAASGLGEWASTALTGPLAAQDQFLGALLDKAKKVAAGVTKIAKKGLSAVGRLLPMGPLFGILRKLVGPLLKRVLDKAIGRLPAPLRPLATQLASRLGGRLGAGEAEGGEQGSQHNLAEAFDRQVTEIVLAPNEAAIEQTLAEASAMAGDGYETAGSGAIHDLDVARDRLARELADDATGQPPTAQMEQFIPVVMAAMPLIRTGVRIVGRQRVENFIAGALARIIQGMLGPQAARLLSRQIASTGLSMLGLEAEADGWPTLGTEALVAAAEDTVRHVMSLPPESLTDELLLETEIQEAFTEAAARHLPAVVLRPEVVEGGSAGEHAIWVMMPRATRPCYRYKKYSRIIPVRVTRPMARSVVLAAGETLESRMLDAGVHSWPVDGEMEIYELLPGGQLGHVVAFETGDRAAGETEDISAATLEFEELTGMAAAVLARDPRLAATGRWGRPGIPGHGRRPGTRYYRLRFGGQGLRRRHHHLFGLRFDLTAPQPVLCLHLRIGERDAHALVGYLERRDLTQVVSLVRGLVGPAAQQTIARRLEQMLTKHGIPLTPGAGPPLAGRLADAMLRAVSQQLPSAAATLTRAAKDPAAGVTLTFGFTFPDKDTIATAGPETPTLKIRAGSHHD